ncbi:MAG: 50S ribosomal protein L10 [Flavobacteriales bacterium]|nr:50S ribosomal protein L10 [Flavobacteriales bacterium]
MTRQEKDQFIDSIAEQLDANKNLYLADVSGMTVGASNDLRRLCFKKGVQLRVVKNTLLKKAMEKVEGNYEESYDILVGNTALMFSESGSLPAKVIKEFRKKSDKPLLKGAYVEESFYVGDDQVDALAAIKSKDELIGEIIGLLQSPAKNVISALQSGGSNLSGILKTLAERPEGSVVTPVGASAKEEAAGGEKTEEKSEAPTEGSAASSEGEDTDKKD